MHLKVLRFFYFPFYSQVDFWTIHAHLFLIMFNNFNNTIFSTQLFYYLHLRSRVWHVAKYVYNKMIMKD